MLVNVDQSSDQVCTLWSGVGLFPLETLSSDLRLHFNEVAV